MYIKQNNQDKVKRLAVPGKVLVIYGPRRVGKTTLIKHVLESYFEKEKNLKTKYYTLDDKSVLKSIEDCTTASLSILAQSYDVIAIDEGQRSTSIGLALKLLVDTFPDKIFIATGSSSFALLQNVGEPLAGRMHTLMHYPFSFNELAKNSSILEESSMLTERLVYGSYPETVQRSTNSEKELYLNDLLKSYLYKDVLAIDEIRKSNVIENLLTMLAYQIGRPVNVTEIANRLQISRITVQKYINLLCDAFILVKLTPYSNNLRTEVNRSERYFFYDLGIRNALLGAYNKLEVRDDIGYLWENYCVIERMKYNQEIDKNIRYYFWRSKNGDEVDLIEKSGANIKAIECKYTSDIPTAKSERAWNELYKDVKIEVINKSNYIKYLL